MCVLRMLNAISIETFNVENKIGAKVHQKLDEERATFTFDFVNLEI